MRMNPSVHDAMKTFISSRRSALVQAIEQLARAGGTSSPSKQEMAGFFQDFMGGSWDAFEEATAPNSGELKEITNQILQLQKQIRDLLGEEHQGIFIQYEDLVNRRATGELDHAFLAGYQTALRLLLMGLLPVPDLMHSGSQIQSEKRKGEDGQD